MDQFTVPAGGKSPSTFASGSDRLRAIRTLAIVAASLLAAGCTTTGGQPAVADVGTGTEQASFRCQSEVLGVDTAFAAGALDSCDVDADGNVRITIAPEDAGPINCSAWYAFRLSPRQAMRTTITLSYTECGHRYWPKISRDGTNWEYLPQDQVEVAEFGGKDFARIDLELDGAPVFISAQEILPPATYDTWLREKAEAGAGQRFVLGQSAEGRDIGGIAIGNLAAREQVVLVGRQHPPEVTGGRAMFAFMEAVASDNPVATAFRQRFLTVAVPLLNPDGVVRGHWRHNTGGVDLNRDWGPFTQPETQLMQELLAAIEDNPAQDLRLMLDFHSTQRDVFYTIPDELPTDPELFTRNWLERYGELMPGYEVSRDARHTAGRPISKAYVYDTFGAPGVTFELGDETDRELIRRIGTQGAIAMMETLLATPAP